MTWVIPSLSLPYPASQININYPSWIITISSLTLPPTPVEISLSDSFTCHWFALQLVAAASSCRLAPRTSNCVRTPGFAMGPVRQDIASHHFVPDHGAGYTCSQCYPFS